MKDPVTPLTPPETETAAQKVANEGYLRRLPVDLDIAVDEAMGGPMGMTISTRLGIAAMKGKWWGKLGCRILNLFQRNHDARAAAGDLARASEVTKVIESSGIATLPSTAPTGTALPAQTAQEQSLSTPQYHKENP